MSRERNEQGQFVGADDETVLEAVEDAGRIATARDVADALDCTREAAYQRLSALHNRGLVERRKVGGRAVVWWKPERQELTASVAGAPSTGDVHTIHFAEGEHDPEGPLFSAPVLDTEEGESIEVADTDEILGDALAGEWIDE
jgi:DNA-binding transcriptional MocR family regulator